MEVHTWDKTEATRSGGYMVILNEIEALKLAENLLYQIRIRSSNNGRLEFTTKDDQYFSVAEQYLGESRHLLSKPTKM